MYKSNETRLTVQNLSRCQMSDYMSNIGLRVRLIHFVVLHTQWESRLHEIEMNCCKIMTLREYLIFLTHICSHGTDNSDWKAIGDWTTIF